MASSKNYTEVLIGGKVFTLSGFESEDYLQKVSTYLNHKIEECTSSDGYRKQSAEARSVLLALNIADDYFKAKKQGGALESDIEAKDKEMYDLKHELISVQIKYENAEKALDKLKAENQELQMKIVQLETEMKNHRTKQTVLRQSIFDTPVYKEKCLQHRDFVYRLFKDRGVKLDRTYQINTGGNTDFLNMLNRDRLDSKKESKTEAVQAVVAERMDDRDIHIGPSDYVPWQDDNKLCFLRMEGRTFGDVPMNIELRLSVEDSPNSAGCVIDAVRCCKLGLERGIGGQLTSISSYVMKHPPVQVTDDEAYENVEKFISGDLER